MKSKKESSVSAPLSERSFLTIFEQSPVSTQIFSPDGVELDGRISKKTRRDKERINQVVINLLTNAIKYSPDTKNIFVTLREDKKNVTVAVRDWGIGIPKAHLKKIFERFYQVAAPKEKIYPGLGIGLYICYQIVMRHGGEMKVESVLKKGSTFSFSLPVGR